jgi:hypothetical protein
LHQHRNFGIGFVGQDIPRLQLAFGVVIGIETNGPRIVFRIVPL